MSHFYSDTVRGSAPWERTKISMEVFQQAKACWDSLDLFRRQRERLKNYVNGKQWEDRIEYNGRMIKESDWIKMQGNIPMVNNLLGKQVRTAIGVYRSQDKEPICIANDPEEQQLGDVMTVALQVNNRLNRMSEKNALAFREYCISGVTISKETFGYRDMERDAWTDIVSPSRAFWRCASADIDMKGLDMIGEIHDLPIGALCSRFAKNQREYRELTEEYKLARNREYINSVMRDLGMNSVKDLDFLVPKETGVCRVIEVWTREQKPRYRCYDPATEDIYRVELDDLDALKYENARRLEQGRSQGLSDEECKLIEYEWFVDNYWYYRYYTPTGKVLAQGETPYAHGSHPYNIKIYPMLDGEAHSLVESGVDQQRNINRLWITYDFIARTSAKGVLMIPEDSLGKYRPEDFAEQWIRPNGYIVYRPSKSGRIPEQISANSTNIGIAEMLNIQLKMIEDVTGINGAIQGKEAHAGTAAALYRQQEQNASTTILDLIESFNSFVRDAALKKVQNIQQFYQGRRMLNVVGRSGIVWYDQMKISNVKFDLAIVEGEKTPAARFWAQDVLLKMWEAGAITAEQMLESAKFPFSEELLQSMKSQRAQAEAGQVPQGLSPQLMGQLQNQTSPQFRGFMQSMSSPMPAAA